MLPAFNKEPIRAVSCLMAKRDTIAKYNMSLF